MIRNLKILLTTIFYDHNDLNIEDVGFIFNFK